MADITRIMDKDLEEIDISGGKLQVVSPATDSKLDTTNLVLNDIKANQTNTTQATKFVDEVGVAYGVKQISNKPRVSSMPYLYDIAEGNVPNHTSFSKIGFAPSMTANVNTDVWSYSAVQPVYVFPTAPMGMEVLSSNNVDDIATVIHSGTSTGGSLTSLISTGENFLTTTAVGDSVVLDKSGVSPEYGYITAIVSDTQLTIAGGFSRGGSGSGRTYSIIDTSSKSGAHAVEISYLDGSYIEKREIILLNGATVIPTVNLTLFRINSFRVILAGANKIPTGNITIRHIDNTPVYSYISAGFNRARNAMYTVPAGKTLYITDFNAGYATTGNANKEYARITTRANMDPTTKFQTDGLFYPFTDSVSQNTTINTVLTIPTKLTEKTDIKISVIASATGIVITTLRGWIE
jgi:hypothetical protein